MSHVRRMARIGVVLLILAALGACTGNACRWWEPCGSDCAPCGDPCDPCDTRR